MLDIERKTACARDRKRGWRRDRAKNMYTFDMPFSIDLCNLSMLSLFHLTFPIELNWINDDDSLNLFQKLSLSLSLFLPPNFHRFFHVYSTTIHIFLDIILLITFKKYCLKQSGNRVELTFTICDRFYLIVAYSSVRKMTMTIFPYCIFRAFNLVSFSLNIFQLINLNGCPPKLFI